MATAWSSQRAANEIEDMVNEEQPVTEKAQEQVKQAAGQVQQQVREVTVQAQEQAKSAIAERKDIAATRLNTVADALRQTGTQMRDQDEDWIARYSNQVADRVENFASFLENRDVEDLMHEVEDFARRKPELFLGGAFTLGLLVARFLKSSQRHGQYQSRYSLTPYEQPTYGQYGQTGSYGYEQAVSPPYTGTSRTGRSSYETGYSESERNV
jgi:hypothetical protein